MVLGHDVRPSTSAVLHHHVPHHGVVFQRIAAQILAVAALFQATTGHFIDQHEMRVHPGAAVAQACRRTTFAFGRHRQCRQTL